MSNVAEPYNESVGAHAYDGDWEKRYNDKPPEKRKRKATYAQTIAPAPAGISFGDEVPTCAKCGHAPHAGRCTWRRTSTGLAGDGEHDLECDCA